MQSSSAMVEKEKEEDLVLDASEISHLDPQLWKELQQDLLERVIAKLPFLKIVDFRRVCKFWYSDVIPRVVAQGEASSSRSAVLYFDFFPNDGESNGSLWWMQIDKANGSLERFQQKSFPSPRLGEDVELIDSQDGLLCFGLKKRKSQMVQDLVVCNPLTAKSKSLDLPRPIKFERRVCDAVGIVGMVFDKERRNYSLVIVGIGGNGRYIALLYNSSTCTWKDCTSMLPTELKVACLHRGMFWSGRSVFCNGNLHWLIKRYRVPGELYPPQYVLEFNSAKEQWRIIAVGTNPRCPYFMETQMAAYNGAIVLWHLCAFRPLVQTATLENVESMKSELFGPNYVSRYPQNMRCSCDFELHVDPQINPMQHCMPLFIERVDGLLSIYRTFGYFCTSYVAFSRQNFVYHVLHLTKSVCRASVFAAIVVHDTNENSYAELPTVSQERCPRFCVPSSDFYTVEYVPPPNVWSFSPSLASCP